MKPGTWIVTVVATCAAAGLTDAFIWLNMPMRLYMTTIREPLKTGLKRENG